MGMIHIDSELAIETLRACVAERGADYVYHNPGGKPGDSCYYWHESEDEGGGEPGCIIGLALYKLGVGVDALLRNEGSTVYNFGEESGVQFSADAYGIFRAAQRIQDGAGTWGEALDVAEVRYKKLKEENQKEEDE